SDCDQAPLMGSNRKTSGFVGGWYFQLFHWSGRGDFNAPPPAPKARALPGCATPPHSTHFILKHFLECGKGRPMYRTKTVTKRGRGFRTVPKREGCNINQLEKNCSISSLIARYSPLQRRIYFPSGATGCFVGSTGVHRSPTPGAPRRDVASGGPT